MLISALRFALAFAFMSILGLAHLIALLVLLPSYGLRVRVSNVFGRILGPVQLAIAGNTVEVVGRAGFDADRPAIYVSNHTSMLDVFVAIGLSPPGTVGVGKASVIWLPVFGQLYALSGNLRLERGDRERSIASLNRLAERVRTHRLSIFYWPEGTRARDGRLLPFKKGVYHLAVATGLPVVPVIVSGMHRALPADTYRLVPTEIRVEVLDPIEASGWEQSGPEAALAGLREVFIQALPEDQRPATA